MARWTRALKKINWGLLIAALAFLATVATVIIGIFQLKIFWLPNRLGNSMSTETI